MKRILFLIIIFCLVSASPSLSFDGDLDGNGVIDTVYGGTNTPALNMEYIEVSDVHRATKYKDSAGAVQRVDLYHDTAVDGSYDAAATVGSIQWAVDQLPSTGGLVHIYPGTYIISDAGADGLGIHIDKSNVIFEGNGPGTVITIADSHDADLFMLYAHNNTGTLENITFRNFNLDGNSANVGATRTYNGICAQDADYLTVDNITTEDGGGNIGYSVFLLQSDYATITKLKKGTFYTNAIEIRSSTGVTISDCVLQHRVEFYSTTENLTFIRNYVYAAFELFTYTEATPGAGCRISNNFFINATANVVLQNFNGLDFFDNTIINTGNDAVALGVGNGSTTSHNARIYNNRISGGYVQMQAPDVEFIDNHIIAPTGLGVGQPIFEDVGTPDNWLISGNTIVGSGGTAARTDVISLDGATDFRIVDNIFRDFSTTGDRMIEIDNSVAGLVATGNIADNCYGFYYIRTPTGAMRFVNNFLDDEPAEHEYSSGQSQTVVALPHIILRSGADATDESGTLQDGSYRGQEIWLSMWSDGGDDWDLTITNHETSSPEIATFDAVDEYLHMRWNGSVWVTVDNTCTFP